MASTLTAMASTLIAVASKPKSDGLQQPAKYILPPGRYLQELCAAGELGNCRVLVLRPQLVSWPVSTVSIPMERISQYLAEWEHDSLGIAEWRG